MDRKLIFIELNEINFDTAYSYIEGGEDLPVSKALKRYYGYQNQKRI